MRIDQPGHLRERHIAVFRREAARLGLVRTGLFMGLLSGSGLLGLCVPRPEPVAPWRWLAVGFSGPLVLTFLRAVVGLWARAPRSMEFRDGVLRLRMLGAGTNLLPEKLDAFVIEPAADSPAIAWCGIVFRQRFFSLRQMWGMYVDDIPAAAAFRREVLRGIPEPRRSTVESGQPP